MKNQIIEARKGKVTDAMLQVARDEDIDINILCGYVAEGKVAILANNRHKNFTPKGVGKGMRVKVNANLGTSPEKSDIKTELEKLEMAKKAGADAVMDLSTGGDLDSIRREIIAHAGIPLGTVPIYQAAVQTVKKKKTITKMDPDELFDVIEKHGQDGVDFITVHCGVTQRSLERLKQQGRTTGIVSRGGAFLAEWIIVNKKENPLYEHYDRLLKIAKKYDMTLSLGDGLRPGCIADATDRGQIEELIILGELCSEAIKNGVQVMIEGPGHVPINQIETNIVLQKRLCNDAPFYVLGPIVTDIAPGYDHITSAIGGALAAYYGADFLCYVTPSEHLGLPDPQDVRDGVIVTRIAAHAADIARGNRNALKMDEAMSTYRKALDWEGQIRCAIDPDRITDFRKGRELHNDVCSMCGEYCSMKLVKDYFKKR
ncbi:MAG TPA: phosphomethylpyrimidine synthase ThiC [Syntrophorhabdaceae bacterium]|nr:phosphomethylpyrimidine synthase ThiC [Syntrophorhabdaceae bacterium]HQH43545.1 phosphomethylpyrimidine synthase ThiC [Syntrophorhabdaceae bacterium]HQK47405.1 phosphomethylpyrimidine synthase ThiC [Syntrophorhabdaceae bacterium]HRV22944.1 phosphomethylpyrimidine synthase ThiC [Syntrophorhabdaceae bacterium]